MSHATWIFERRVFTGYTQIMDDRKRTLAAITVILGVVVLVLIVIGMLVSGKKVVSPVPDEDAIKIIFVSPSPLTIATSTPTPTVSPTPGSKAKSTPKPTVKP